MRRSEQLISAMRYPAPRMRLPEQLATPERVLGETRLAEDRAKGASWDLLATGRDNDRESQGAPACGT